MSKKNDGLFSTMDEVHAFLLGFFEALPPWKGPYRYRLPVPEYLKKEQHYYKGGRWVGFVVAVLVLIGLSLLVKQVWF